MKKTFDNRKRDFGWGTPIKKHHRLKTDGSNLLLRHGLLGNIPSGQQTIFQFIALILGCKFHLKKE